MPTIRITPTAALATSVTTSTIAGDVGAAGDGGRAETREARDAAIVADRERGLSLGTIAEEFGLTRERVRQIIAERGGPDRAEVRRIREARVQREREALRDRCLEHIETRPGLTLEAVAEAVGASPDSVRRALGADARRLLAGVPRRYERVPDAALLSELRFAAGLVRGPLTGPEYDRIRRELGLHSRVLLVQRFGSWGEACRRAGVAPVSAPRDNYTRRWTRSEMLHWVACYLSEPGVRGTFSGYEEYARRTPDAPSGATVRNEVGQWNVIKAEALRHGVDPGLAPESPGDSCGWLGVQDWEDVDTWRAESESPDGFTFSLAAVAA